MADTMTTRTETERSADGKGLRETGIITFNGKEYESGGAFHHPDSDIAIGYLSADETSITGWSGAPIGSARIVSMWDTPRSFLSSEMFQIEANIGGVIYTGRSAGSGMLWKGKRKAKQVFRAPSFSVETWNRRKASRAARA